MVKGIRWTIALKVGGTVFVLLAVILALLIHSVLSLQEIDAELKEVSLIDVPLTEYANEIEIMQLEQRIVLDEYVRTRLAGNVEDKSLLKDMLVWSQKMDNQFDLAINTAGLGLETDSKEQFETILASLNGLKLTHIDVHNDIERLMAGGYNQTRLDEILQKDEAFDRTAIELIHTIERLAKRKAQIALKHEEQFSTILFSLGAAGGLIGIILSILVVVGLRRSINKLSKNVSLVTDAMESKRSIPVEELEQLKTSDELGGLSEDLSNMIERVSADRSELEQQTTELEEKATVDHLTKCFNRMKWDEMRVREVTDSLAEQHDLSLIFFDIDHFKKINDTYGHDVGDETLIDVAKVAKSVIRENDTIYRTGGEEFSILLPKTNVEQAHQLADRIRENISNFSFSTVGRVTVSLGVTQYKTEGDSDTEFAKRADLALYQSKGAGRNCVSVLA